ncbi:MAG: Undecaprenyl-phosphate galactose phosphotransferase [Candidatus Sulfotelmatobacter sp.]|nr:Undecaprenyl-phosphate galactose phosphotransferase [Candidatus Sulfotelmatobacter sp.]
MNLRRAGNGLSSYVLSAERVLAGERRVLDEESFRRMLSLERKRAERSGKAFLLMLLDIGTSNSATQSNGKGLENIVSTLMVTTRETDITGWYQGRMVVGVMFTELIIDEKDSILSTMLERVTNVLRGNLTFEQFNQIGISFHLFPDDWNHESGQRPSNATLYPDLIERDESRRPFRVMKRVMDIIGSFVALVFLSPLFLMVASAIKLTSRGPVLFRQNRIGQHGKPFLFLKFRSMHANNDAREHREYVKKLIAGTAEKQQSNGKDNGVYKLTKDSRVTRVGSFLRRTSLDELPQFLNVLQGNMSLVGPRPPVPYEVEAYDLWHRRRLLEAKPGITGLWQVNGRSKVKFDDMVRLDLRYARTWSPWMDLKILLRTPSAVVLGEGAH